jgi:sulfur relay (sulfurtransferase) complex TusBCD TusD component (DsrE family)
MAKYLLIESRDPYDSNDTQHFYDLAQGLRKDGNDVTLFLVQNGVLPARRGAKAPALEAVAKAGVEVLADDFSLRERGIAAGALAPGVRAAPIDVVVDQLEEGRKALWH